MSPRPSSRGSSGPRASPREGGASCAAGSPCSCTICQWTKRRKRRIVSSSSSSSIVSSSCAAHSPTRQGRALSRVPLLRRERGSSRCGSESGGSCGRLYLPRRCRCKYLCRMASTRHRAFHEWPDSSVHTSSASRDAKMQRSAYLVCAVQQGAAPSGLRRRGVSSVWEEAPPPLSRRRPHRHVRPPVEARALPPHVQDERLVHLLEGGHLRGDGSWTSRGRVQRSVLSPLEGCVRLPRRDLQPDPDRRAVLDSVGGGGALCAPPPRALQRRVQRDRGAGPREVDGLAGQRRVP